MDQLQGWTALVAAIGALALGVLDRRRDSLRARIEDARRDQDRIREEEKSTIKDRDEYMRLYFAEQAKVAGLEAEVRWLRSERKDPPNGTHGKEGPG